MSQLPAAWEFQALVPFVLILIAVLLARVMNVVCRRFAPPSPVTLMGPSDATMPLTA
jgi:hypothetical protein